MLTKTKNIRKKKCFQKFKNGSGIWPRGSNNQNLKEIHAIGSEIIDAIDGRKTDKAKMTDKAEMTSVDIVKQS